MGAEERIDATRPRIFSLSELSQISSLDSGVRVKRQIVHTQDEQLKEAQDDLNRLLEFSYVSRKE